MMPKNEAHDAPRAAYRHATRRLSGIRAVVALAKRLASLGGSGIMVGLRVP
jgi:hypothetical protein